MSITIKKIELKNFRQYKDVSFSFSSSSSNQLHVLKAKNGTGKTTFLNAITWCLYGEEKYLNDKEKALPLVNDSVVRESQEGDRIIVSVIITIHDSSSNQFVTFERKQVFNIKNDRITSRNKVIENDSFLTIALTEVNSSKNSKIIDQSENTEVYVDLYFNKSIFDYYFFDGENLRNYFSKGKSEKIRESIFNISQVTLLENTQKRSKNLADSKSRLANKNNPDSLKLIDEKSTLEKEINKREEEIKKSVIDIPAYEKLKSEADDIISSYKPVKSFQSRKLDKIKEHHRLLNDQKIFKEKQNEFIQEYLILLNFYPRIKRTYQMICHKEDHDELPPNINKKEIKEILDNHLTNCPVCNSELNDHAFGYLQKILDETAVSTGTSHHLMLIKSSLEEMIEEVELYKKRRDKLIEEEKNINKNLKEVEKDLEEIHSYLSNYSDEDIESRIATAETNSKYYKEKIDELTSKMSENRAYNKRDNDRLKKINSDLETIEKKKKERDILSKQVTIFRSVSSTLNDIQNNIMSCIKDDIEKDTWKMFDAMIWKRYTFKSLEINDNYDLTIYNMDGKIMTGSLSATEYMALAYAFTIAIHKASGKNCPLVVDSPLGRVSDENREKMANELLKVSKNKQIIMLFTPDEYSAEVAEVYEGKAASIRVLSLSDDEQEIIGGNV